MVTIKLKGAFNAISSCFNKLTAPNPKYISDKAEYKVAHNRNKAVVFIQLFAMTSYILNLITGQGSSGDHIQGFFGTSGICIVLFLSCRFHPELFKFIFNIYALIFGAMLMNHGDGGIIGAWLSAPIYPILVFLLTASIKQFVINAILQVILLHTVYQKKMEASLIYMRVEETTKSLIFYSHQNLMYSIIFTIVIQCTLQTALYEFKVADKKKDDFEKQKNFLLGFSHELRNLINSLMGNVKLASLEVLSEKVRDQLLNAEVCAELLLHLVNNILDTGKVEIGELEINPTPTRVYKTMERIWSVCSELIKRKNLRGRIKIQKNIPQVLTLDHYRITQIFLNLVGNAVKYTDTGSIDITVEWISDKEKVDEKCFEPYPFNDQDEGIFEKLQALSVFDESFIFLNFCKKKIDNSLLPLKVNSQKGVLKISVSDTGCGIPKDGFDKLFQRFTQVTSDESKKKLGTGLGLFITKELCTRMGGEIKVFSKKEIGSTFIFCLPLEPIKDEKLFAFDLEELQKVIKHKQPRAMVVDDEKLSQIILRDFLTKMDIFVSNIVENGLVAFEKFKKCQKTQDFVNIVTMDLNMPIMDGKMSAQKIREFEIEKNLEPCLLIIISGNCSESEINECMDKNGKIRANAFLKKPVSIDELCRVISCHLAQYYDQHRVRLLSD